MPPATPFSPLFIGEDSSTLSGASHFPAAESFQSPLHRGRLFNFARDRQQVAALGLSVPSSSGKTLQRLNLAVMPRRIVPFSPLFIGEDSSTKLNDAISRQDWLFQSPLHRGRLFNASTLVPPTVVVRTFSPLFIGEDSSTPQFAQHCFRRKLSVPSSSGKTLQQSAGTDE